MIAGLLAALVILTAAHLVVLDRRDKRGFDERQAEREVTDRLLQRIQAPEVAVQQALPPSLDPPAVNSFDENDYWAAKAEQDEALARMEQWQRDLG